MVRLTDIERQIAINSIGPRFKIRVGTMVLMLTIKEIDQLRTEITSFKSQRNYIQENPWMYNDDLHGDLFTKEEKINLGKNVRG